MKRILVCVILFFVAERYYYVKPVTFHYWLTSTQWADLNNDGIVNFIDYALEEQYYKW